MTFTFWATLFINYHLCLGSVKSRAIWCSLIILSISEMKLPMLYSLYPYFLRISLLVNLRVAKVSSRLAKVDSGSSPPLHKHLYDLRLLTSLLIRSSSISSPEIVSLLFLMTRYSHAIILSSESLMSSWICLILASFWLISSFISHRAVLAASFCHYSSL